MLRWRRVAAIGVGVVTTGAVCNQLFVTHSTAEHSYPESLDAARIPVRSEQLKRLQEQFDVIVIGGGATGAGATLDATTRGLKVACFEKEDFAAGTSSRSTKLIHGGVRYLEKAFTQFDLGNLWLVVEGLHERKQFMDTAPHLTHPLPIITPCFHYWELAYYWVGLKFYDLFALGRRLYSSYYLSRDEALRQFPMMTPKDLKGAVVYYDGQMNDSRMAVSLAVTAATKGAVVLNHTSVIDLIKDTTGHITGVTVRDNLTGETYHVHSKVVINACGPFVDAICKLDDPNHRNLIIPAQGTHVILPNFYSPANMGLIVPKTKDGRVVFMLPWLGHTIAGTTDEQVELTDRPYAREHEVQFILSALSDHLRVEVRPSDVLAVWAGIRPLALDPTKLDTQSLSRNHVLVESASGLLTITGGKWTTYRKMAEDVIDLAVSSGRLSAGKCGSEQLQVIGGSGWDRAMFTKLTQHYERVKSARGKESVAPMNTDIALHLSHSYGTQAFQVAQLAGQGWGKRLCHGHPHIEAEVIYAIRFEYALTVTDVIARRTRLAFIDSAAARSAIPRVVDLMAHELGWTERQKKSELKDALAFLETMSLPTAAPQVVESETAKKKRGWW